MPDAIERGFTFGWAKAEPKRVPAVYHFGNAKDYLPNIYAKQAKLDLPPITSAKTSQPSNSPSLEAAGPFPGEKSLAWENSLPHDLPNAVSDDEHAPDETRLSDELRATQDKSGVNAPAQEAGQVPPVRHTTSPAHVIDHDLNASAGIEGPDPIAAQHSSILGDNLGQGDEPAPESNIPVGEPRQLSSDHDDINEPSSRYQQRSHSYPPSHPDVAGYAPRRLSHHRSEGLTTHRVAQESTWDRTTTGAALPQPADHVQDLAMPGPEVVHTDDPMGQSLFAHPEHPQYISTPNHTQDVHSLYAIASELLEESRREEIFRDSLVCSS